MCDGKGKMQGGGVEVPAACLVESLFRKHGLHLYGNHAWRSEQRAECGLKMEIAPESSTVCGRQGYNR